MGFHSNPFRQLDPVDITADSAHATVTSLAGIAVRESAGSAAAATVIITKEEGDEDGSGQLIIPIELAANESVTLILPGTIECPEGVYVDVTGEVSGVLYRWV